MLLSEVMTRVVDTIDSSASVLEAARKMAEHDIGCLPIVHEGVTAGVVTDRDLVVRVMAAGKSPEETRVAEVMSHGPSRAGEVRTEMTSGVITLPEDTEVETAVELMDQKDIRRVLVHNHNYEVVGIVSRSDLPPAAIQKA